VGCERKNIHATTFTSRTTEKNLETLDTRTLPSGSRYSMKRPDILAFVLAAPSMPVDLFWDGVLRLGVNLVAHAFNAA